MLHTVRQKFSNVHLRLKSTLILYFSQHTQFTHTKRAKVPKAAKKQVCSNAMRFATDFQKILPTSSQNFQMPIDGGKAR